MPYVRGQIIKFLNKRIGKNVILNYENSKEYLTEADAIMKEQKKYTRPETYKWHHRHLSQYKPSDWRTKYWEDTVRHYDQRRVSFFVQSVLAKKKISIPLR